MQNPTLTKLTAWCWLGLALACNTAEANDNLRLRYININDKLGSDAIGAIKVIRQDPLGFIWLGGENGLARYDGTVLTRYKASTSPNSLSSNFVNDIEFDHHGNMWIATDEGINYYNSDTDDFKRLELIDARKINQRVVDIEVDADNNLVMALDAEVTILNPARTHLTRLPLPQYNPNQFVSINDLFIDRHNIIWLATKGSGVAILDTELNRFRFFRHYPNNPATIISDDISCIDEDQLGNLWFGTFGNGISRLTPNANAFTNYSDDPGNHYSIGKHTIWDITTDQLGVVWIATDHGGLARFDPELNGFMHTKNNPYDPTSIASNQIRKIYEDRMGNLWIGLFPNGLNFYNREFQHFTNYTHRPNDPRSISHNAILAITRDSTGQLWVGTEDGLNVYNAMDNSFQSFQHLNGDPTSLKANAVLSLVEDENENLWVGTWSGGVHRFDRLHQQFYNYSSIPKIETSLSNNFVWAMARDNKGVLWLGTEGGGLNRYRPTTDDFVRYLRNQNDPNSLTSNFIWTMSVDHLGILWLGTSAGLNRFDPQTDKVTAIAGINSDHPLQKNRIRALTVDSQQRLWIGTQDSGIYLYDLKTNTLTDFLHNEQLPAKYITGFVEDHEGYIWASSTNGLIKIHSQTLAIEIFDETYGLPGTNFNREANFIDAEGNIYFGATEGLTVFNPKYVRSHDLNYPVVMTKLRIFNKDVTIGAENSPLKKVLWLTDKVQLTHQHSMFSIDFSALEFQIGEHKEYAYQLQGFDQDWIHIGREHSATFTNLRPGQYTLRVKAGTNGNWSSQQPQLTIIVSPPPWFSWWAYCLYVAALAILFLLIIYTLVKQTQLNHERQHNQELKNLNDIKDAFLANTSHELRTPLNGIIGIADTLEERFQHQDQAVANHLHIIASSGRRLANLINDILDYSKLAKKNLSINQAPVDICAATESVFNLLEPLASNKQVQLQHRFVAPAPILSVDANRLQQILINLIGNGIKYTSAGSVTVTATELSGWAEIGVEDTGIGIPKDQQEAIFEAFNQIQSDSTREFGGTGLGLAITKQLIELHQGKIWVDDTYQSGSRLVFTMPLATDQTTDKLSPTTPLRPLKQHNLLSLNSALSPVQPKAPRNTCDQTILIVDDDSVNRLVLSGILASHHYQVLEAENGQQAIDIVNAHSHIQLVIMDVMMPKMSGFEACKMLRQNYALYELPILFLTAKRNIDDDIQQCFAAGGNDYLCKPVSKHDLLPRVANHLRLRGIVHKLQMELEDKSIQSNI